jgi:hypothetical protein
VLLGPDKGTAISISPSYGIFVRSDIFRESMGYASQACIEDACGQIAEFDVSRAFPSSWISSALFPQIAFDFALENVHVRHAV